MSQRISRICWNYCRHNDPVPDGKMVNFLDGDKDNCDIANLALIDNVENMNWCTAVFGLEMQNLQRREWRQRRYGLPRGEEREV